MVTLPALNPLHPAHPQSVTPNTMNSYLHAPSLVYVQLPRGVNTGNAGTVFSLPLLNASQIPDSSYLPGSLKHPELASRVSYPLSSPIFVCMCLKNWDRGILFQLASSGHRYVLHLPPPFNARYYKCYAC